MSIWTRKDGHIMDFRKKPWTEQETGDQDEEVLLDPLATDEETLLDPPDRKSVV